MEISGLRGASLRASNAIIAALFTLCVLLIGEAVQPVLASGPVISSMAGGSDDGARVAWTNPTGNFSYWHAAAGGSASATNYGPYPGWSPDGVATGGNNVPRVMWNSTTGAMSLWSLTESSGAFTQNSFGPYTGWKAKAIAVGANNAPRVLWTSPSGAASLWNISASGTYTFSNFGPFTGWTPTFLAVGPNNAPRLLWVAPSGAVSLWGNADAPLTYANYGPFAGWSAISMAVDSTNAPRILWSHPADGTVSLWNVGTNTAYTYLNFTAPAGFTPRGIIAGSAGSVRLVWVKADGTTQIWWIAASGSVTSKITYPSPAALTLTPANVPGGTASTGTVTINAPAMSGGVTVTLASDSALATVPATVLVPAGVTSATFPVTTTKPTTAAGATAHLSATCNGVTLTTSLSIAFVSPPAALTTLTLAPASVPGGTASVGTVTLSAAAPAGGVTVTLASDNTLAVVPATVVVPAGATAATFTAATTNLAAPGSATANISATYGSVTQKAALTITYKASMPVTGVYRLTTKGQQGLALDVAGFGMNNGSTVQIWNAAQTCNQQWLVEAQTDGTFKLHPYSGVNTNQVLDDNNGSITTGNKVTTYQDNGNDAQHWYFVDIGGGFYRIVPKNAGVTSLQTLDLSGGESAAAGSVTAIYPYYGGSNQIFRLDPPGPTQPTPGIYRISTRGNPTLSLDVTGFNNADGTNVQLFTANHTSNQQWLVGTTGSNLYSIAAFSAENSLQMLDDNNGTTVNGNNVTTFTDNGAPAQRWYFEDIGGGYSRIVPSGAGAASLQTLDVRNGNNAKLGDTLNIYSYYGGDNQVFSLNDPGPIQLLVNPKKGIGGKEFAGWGLHNSWYYTWGSTEPTDAPPGTEFVPMQWGYYGGDNTSWLNSVVASVQATQPGTIHFLAFNEPDHPDQANLTVPYALTGYQYMSNVANASNGTVQVGSPACADDNDSWFSGFMAGVGSNNYHVDFIAVHCYIRDPNQFLSYIDNLHNVYWQYPLWITEFAPADWSGTNPVSVGECETFMKTVVPALNSRWYVARYAWYTGTDPGGSGTLSSAGLVNTDGSLSDMGLLYGRM